MGMAAAYDVKLLLTFLGLICGALATYQWYGATKSGDAPAMRLGG